MLYQLLELPRISTDRYFRLHTRRVSDAARLRRSLFIVLVLADLNMLGGERGRSLIVHDRLSEPGDLRLVGGSQAGNVKRLNIVIRER